MQRSLAPTAIWPTSDANYIYFAELPTKNSKGNALNRQFEQLNNLVIVADNSQFTGLVGSAIRVD
jgi:hypothetical protein